MGKVSKSLRQLLDFGLDFALPRACWRCGTCTTQQAAFCDACNTDLERCHSQCLRCGQILAVTQDRCGRCLSCETTQDQTLSPFIYNGAIAEKIKALKYHERIELAKPLAKLLWNEVMEQVNTHFDLICPVPAHSRRLRERGFNQAGLIAREFARLSNSTFAPNLLIKHRSTSPQAGSTKRLRKLQVGGSMRAESNSRTMAQRPALEPGTAPALEIAIIDDVLTTGATVKEASRALRAKFRTKITVITLAVSK